MNSIYINQSSKELRLNLVYSELNKSNLNIIKSESISYDDIHVELGIIGASHFITIKFEETQFSEVFACLELSNTSEICVVKNIDELLIPIKKSLCANLKYEFSSNILDWNDLSAKKYYEFLKNTDLYSNCQNSVGLSHDFPYEENDKYIAKTELFVRRYVDEIIIETLHAYPNEEKIVFTKSKIKKV